jgi:hypothetical protein
MLWVDKYRPHSLAGALHGVPFSAQLEPHCHRIEWGFKLRRWWRRVGGGELGRERGGAGEYGMGGGIESRAARCWPAPVLVH